MSERTALCPFCGGLGQPDEDAGDGAHGPSLAWIQCGRCHARGPLVSGDSDGPSDAMRAAARNGWNQRFQRR